MSLVFKKIESGDIFTRDFSPLVRNKENRLVLPPGRRLLRAEFQSADIKAASRRFFDRQRALPSPAAPFAL